MSDRRNEKSEQLEDAMGQRKKARKRRKFDEPFVKGSPEYILAERCANDLMKLLYGSPPQQPTLVDESVEIENNTLNLVDSLSLVDVSMEEIASGSGTKEDPLICEDETDTSSDEEIDVFRMKKEFMSSHTDCKDKKCCVKCNTDGQLLICSGVSCPVVVHDGCLGEPRGHNSKGDFLCPFCFYSLAVSECKEAKKRADIARKQLYVSWFEGEK